MSPNSRILFISSLRFSLSLDLASADCKLWMSCMYLVIFFYTTFVLLAVIIFTLFSFTVKQSAYVFIRLNARKKIILNTMTHSNAQ